VRNLLVGNGINLQFDKSYLNHELILRILLEVSNEEYPKEYICEPPELIKVYIGRLYLEVRSVLDGDYDVYVATAAEKNALIQFKERYQCKYKELKITDIGFEDYYFLHDLSCNKLKKGNPDRYVIRECMKMAYFHSIYNEGKVNKLYEEYSEKLKQYLYEFDNILTTNYDQNLSFTTNKEIIHIHGQFDKYSDTYSDDSVLNQIDSKNLEGIPNEEEYKYLHSTALSTYAGEYKQYQMNQAKLANSGITKFAEGYKKNEEIRKEIDSWENADPLTRKMAQAIKIKISNPEAQFTEHYQVEKLSAVEGELEILGLSPYNDFHIFESINENQKLEKCIYYFFNEIEKVIISSKLEQFSGQLEFEDVNGFWEKMG
jgi:hypothetical protein